MKILKGFAFSIFLLLASVSAFADIIDGAFKVLSTNWNGGYPQHNSNPEYLKCKYFSDGVYYNSLKELDFNTILVKSNSELKKINEELLNKHLNKILKFASFNEKMLFVFNNSFILTKYCDDSEISKAVAKTLDIFNKELTNL